MHGQRTTAARILAEVGSSVQEIASITRHKSLAQVEQRTRSGSQQLRSIGCPKVANNDLER